jgi:hypothetical protein
MLLLVSGATRSLARLADPRFGLLFVPGAWNDAETLPALPWAADNGAFVRFDAERFVAMLKRLRARARGCLFVVAPDVVGDAAQTLALFTDWTPRIRAYGFPVALAAQDGLTSAAVPWADLDALFVGGTTAFKLSPAMRALAHEAKARGKWLHMGRVNTRRRFRYALALGCDSIDGSRFSRWADTALPLAQRWLGALRAQPELPDL